MRTLARYKVVRTLGRGGAGGVFLVEDLVLGGALVALKRINGEADDLLRASFEREFAALAALALPGVARVFDFGLAEADGEDAGGPFFTRAFVEGRTLDEAAQTLGTAARLRLFAEVAAIVVPLHRAGIVHGDLKPSNVVVDTAGQPQLIDFGLARASGDATEGSGTPAFMAPELIQGGGASVRADVYALGVTLWHVVTGRLPWEELGARAMAAKLAGRAPEMPKGLDATAQRALEVAQRAFVADPALRTPAATELVAALDAIVPPLVERTAPRGFVAPRPRGHDAAVARLDSRVAARLDGSEPEAGALLLRAPRGAGKTTLLRELRWRLQLRGVRVLDATARGSDGVAPLVALLRQAVIFSGDDELARRAGERVLASLGEAATLDEPALADALTRVLGAVVRRGPTVVLVDDLDVAEAPVGAALRNVAHADAAPRAVVVAASADDAAPATRELGSRELVEVPLLTRAHAAELVDDVLGPVDPSVVSALHERTGGVPGRLVEALEALSHNQAPTAADVAALPVDELGTATASARLGLAPPEAGAMLDALAVLDASVPRATLLGLGGGARAAVALDACERTGLVVRGPDGCALADRSIGAVCLTRLGVDGVKGVAATLLRSSAAQALTTPLRARLAVAADDETELEALVPRAAGELMALGANRGAATLWDALLARASGTSARSARLALARLRHATGEYGVAADHARAVLDDPEATSTERADAAVAAGRALTAAGAYDEAARLLALVPTDASARARATAQRELAKMHVRRGDYEAANAAAEAGLAMAEPHDLVRVELLNALGMVASYRGDHAAARSRYGDALALARASGSRRDEANALTYLAIDHQRAGELALARELYAQSLEIARGLGDVGSMATFALNLGVVSMAMREPARAAEHYEAAARLARRAGRASTDVMARANLANLHVYLGLYERARVEAESALRDAEAAGLKLSAAQAVALLGDLRARAGDVDGALARYDDAIARYRELGQRREVAEVQLDAVEALQDRGGPADASAAAARLAASRTIVDEEHVDDLRPQLKLLLARARIEAGDADGALEEIELVLKEARDRRDRDLEWRALAAAGSLHAARGAEFLARRHDQLAVEVLESIAATLPRDHRDAFWQDPRRREVRRRAALAGEAQPPGDFGTVHRPAAADARYARLLELIKRLASEHEVDRLLERITDSAIELTGAERGFVLLAQERGDIETRTARDSGSQPSDPHAAFSRSIAEAVLIDGEPIVTVDAQGDRRLSEYMSVHKLSLKSVACLPIRGKSGVVGVLYLEHRLRRGRFGEADVDLLLALADQAAIALENARLHTENARRATELAQANEQLESAKDDIERLLVARTAELDETRRELGRARDELKAGHAKHGIVGRSPSMLRVFSIIDRVCESSVPLVIHGESGTGKELVARAIHYGGPRAAGPFVAINCAAIPETLLESEIFGHVRGAFTGADRDRRGVVVQAHGGTLFLDEVGDMPAKMQVDLLRVIADGKIRPIGGDKDEATDVRFIAASNKQLGRLVAAGKFREDLYYRLNVVEIVLPPLRERAEDVPLLAEHFLAAIAKQSGGRPKRLTRDAIRRIQAHPLPGNVRQLEHLLLNACVMVEDDVIDAADLALGDDGGPARPLPSVAPSAQPEDDLDDEAGLDAGELPPQSFDEFKTSERKRILTALESSGWNRAKAAKALGVPRRTFYRRLKEHGILE